MMLLAAAAAEAGESCFAFIFCLAVWLAGYKKPRVSLLYHLADSVHPEPKPNMLCVHSYTQPHTTRSMTAVRQIIEVEVALA